MLYGVDVLDTVDELGKAVVVDVDVEGVDITNEWDDAKLYGDILGGNPPWGSDTLGLDL